MTYTPSALARRVSSLLRHPLYFAEFGNGLRLRAYQVQPFLSVIDSIRKRKGLSFVIIFSRQSGKDELLSMLFSYLLTLFQNEGGDMLVFNPTYKPQTIRAMWRLQVRLSANILTRGKWKKNSGYIYRVNLARCIFMSADESANIVGETASLAIFANEAQDITPAKFDKDVAPMGASTNATRVYCGTRWTDDTLLEREYKAAKLLQDKDGIQRIFFVNCDDVRKAVPAYGLHVDKEIEKLGRDHPLIRTQYFCECIDAQAGMFNETRRALMKGDMRSPEAPRNALAFLVDVAGTDESKREGWEGLTNPGRDSSTLSIVGIDFSSIPTLQKPTYRVLARYSWTGDEQTLVFGALSALADTLKPNYIVVDATGVGEGLTSLLFGRYGQKVLGFKWSAQSKSEVGYKFLSIINTGRFRDCASNKTVEAQYRACKSEVLVGPGHLMRWYVPEGYRDPASGETVHDDYILADALVSNLDDLEWTTPTDAVEVPAPDIFESLKGY